MTKHTPGPWHVEPREGIDPGFGLWIGNTNPGQGYVAEILNEDGLTAVDHANARLIAAAPDMLAALGRLVWLNTSQGVSDDDYDTAMENANAVIARARGEG